MALPSIFNWHPICCASISLYQIRMAVNDLQCKTGGILVPCLSAVELRPVSCCGWRNKEYICLFSFLKPRICLECIWINTKNSAHLLITCSCFAFFIAICQSWVSCQHLHCEHSRGYMYFPNLYETCTKHFYDISTES